MQESDRTGLLTLYSDVRPSPVNWLWYPYIAVGKITLLQGDPADGKSTMMLHLIAELSRGGKTPDGKSLGRPQKAIYQCSEDGVSDTIKPRLIQHGADCQNIAFINEDAHGSLTLDDERLRQAIIDFRPRLLVIDPIQAYFGCDSDLQIAGRARKLMHRLGLWASTYDCAIVLIGHLNKKSGSKDLYRNLGSIDVIAAARSVLQVERDAVDPEVRVVRQIKNSLESVGEAVTFEIRRETGFRWINTNGQLEKQNVGLENFDVPTTKMDKAAVIIKDYLVDGDAKATEMYKRLKEAGISHKTAEITRKELGSRCYRKMKQWYWHLDKTDNKEGIDTYD